MKKLLPAKGCHPARFLAMSRTIKSILLLFTLNISFFCLTGLASESKADNLLRKVKRITIQDSNYPNSDDSFHIEWTDGVYFGSSADKSACQTLIKALAGEHMAPPDERDPFVWLGINESECIYLENIIRDDYGVKRSRDELNRRRYSPPQGVNFAHVDYVKTYTLTFTTHDKEFFIFEDYGLSSFNDFDSLSQYRTILSRGRTFAQPIKKLIARKAFQNIEKASLKGESDETAFEEAVKIFGEDFIHEIALIQSSGKYDVSEKEVVHYIAMQLSRYITWVLTGDEEARRNIFTHRESPLPSASKSNNKK